MNGARAASAVAAPIAIAALAMRAIATHAPTALGVQLSQPLAVLTGAGRFGAIQLCILIAALTIATIPYRMLVRQERAARGSTLALAMIATILCAWALPVAFSSDVYAYAAYGEAVLRGLDPFARLTVHGSDALFAAARVQWGPTLPACVYGWGFVAVAASVARIFQPWGVAAQIAGLRALASLAMVACGALTFAAVSGNRAQRLRAAALVGCNPVALWCAAEGHNDALAIALGLFGCALARYRPQFGAAIAGMAGAFKLPAVLAALPAARRRAWPGAVVGAAVAVAATWPVLGHWTSGSNAHGAYAPHVSLQGLLFAVFVPAFGRAAGMPVTLLVAVVVAGVLAWGAVAEIRSGRRQGWIRLALAAWLLIPNPYPWYGLWLLAVAAVAPQTREADAAIWVPLASLLRYYPDAAGLPSFPLEVILAVLALLPYTVLLPARGSAIINRPL